ncbi:Hypothetical predicted protein [Olea europaea subsp. europaea]|uniref:SMP domain-containing protein n=1 Tax=Olea europaea subsp. europaea TaxID=158383 RepID=A0A8S0TNG1_OLEEU|nr:Hypothetical predicted protein [Olea europaea subsp. europaea]
MSAELRNDPNLTAHLGGVAATVAAAARINEKSYALLVELDFARTAAAFRLPSLSSVSRRCHRSQPINGVISCRYFAMERGEENIYLFSLAGSALSYATTNYVLNSCAERKVFKTPSSFN